MKGIDTTDDRLVLKNRKNMRMGKGIVSAGIALSLSISTGDKFKFTSMEIDTHKKIVEEDLDLKIESDAYDMIRASL